MNASHELQHADYLAGQALYGDDFTPEQIAVWYELEREGYAGLGAANRDTYDYAYHALNELHGYAILPRRRYAHGLGLGSAYGDEFLPVLDAIDHLVISDPSASFVQGAVHGHPVEYVRQAPNGDVPFADRTFDLILCLGVLHHIPNVSHVLGELRRVLAPGGIALVREPIVSMGDWRVPRRGLTPNERGLPLAVFRDMLRTAGFGVRRERLCVFPPLVRMCARLGVMPFKSTWITRLDAVLCRAFAFNYRYHRVGLAQKFAPTSVFYVLDADD